MHFSQSLFYIFICLISLNTHAVRNGSPTTQFEERTLVRFKIGKNICSGVRISKDYALSAAHCFSKMKKNSRFKAVFMNGNALLTKSLRSTKVKIYGTSSSYEDLAVVKITPSNPSKEPTQVVKFGDTKLSEHIYGDIFTILGFGTDHNGRLNQLNSAEVQFNGLYQEEEEDEFLLIRVKPTDADSNPCTGDSGGPLFRTDENGERTLIGIVSFISSTSESLGELNQKEQCNKADRAYYVPIIDHLNFIEQFIEL